MLDDHYDYECTLRKSFGDGNQREVVVDCRDGWDMVDEIRDRVTENVQQGELISRVISKRPELLCAEDSGSHRVVREQRYRECVKTMVSEGTQTYVRQ